MRTMGFDGYLSCDRELTIVMGAELPPNRRTGQTRPHDFSSRRSASRARESRDLTALVVTPREKAISL